MTESQRTALLTACSFAKVFIESADHELRGGDPSWREEAASQLQAALRNLEQPAPDVPVVDWPEIGRLLDAE